MMVLSRATKNMARRTEVMRRYVATTDFFGSEASGMVLTSWVLGVSAGAAFLSKLAEDMSIEWSLLDSFAVWEGG
jgi:hypothetical protein